MMKHLDSYPWAEKAGGSMGWKNIVPDYIVYAYTNSDSDKRIHLMALPEIVGPCQGECQGSVALPDI